MLTYANCLTFVWAPERDGQPYHVTPGDRGLGTAWGVTAATWAAWAGETGRHVALQDAPKADLAALLHARYWVPAGQGLASGVNLMVFDFAITSGPARSVRFLQAILDVPQDGNCGPLTQAAAEAYDPATLCQRLHDRQAAFYRSDPQFARFGGGWLRRCADRLGVALASLAS